MQTVLVIEDDPDMRLLLSLMVRKLQYRPLEASNGYLGITLALDARPDVVLCDVMMTDMNGYDTCRNLRASGYEGKIILMSAYVDSDMAHTTSLAGGDAIAAKPLNLAVLRQHLQSALVPQSV